MATTSAAARQLADQNSQGTVLGVNASTVIGFYGITTAAKPGLPAISGTSFGSLSLSSGALASSIAIALNNLGLIFCSSMSA